MCAARDGLHAALAVVLNDEHTYGVDPAGELCERNNAGDYVPVTQRALDRECARLCGEYGKVREWTPELGKKVMGWLKVTQPDVEVGQGKLPLADIPMLTDADIPF